MRPSEHAKYLVGEALSHLFDALKVKYNRTEAIEAIQKGEGPKLTSQAA